MYLNLPWLLELRSPSDETRLEKSISLFLSACYYYDYVHRRLVNFRDPLMVYATHSRNIAAPYPTEDFMYQDPLPPAPTRLRSGVGRP